MSHCKGGIHTKGAMKGGVDILGSKIWTAEAIVPRREDPKERTTEMDGILTGEVVR